VTVCVPLPKPGVYALAVRHDANGNQRSDWNDGAGFSRNPRLSLFSRPSLSEVAVTVGEGTLRLAIRMNYRKGLSVGPIR